MPRIGRVVAPNMPHHVVQRGHNRNAVFVDDGDYSYYLDTLGKWTRHLQVKVYAWCLMTNHVHLLHAVHRVRSLILYPRLKIKDLTP